ncbi:hypothetical protein D8Y22_12245 [Salinadaptatus halalkaliphilus]|uniref:Mechanosensitive ion channel n=1 Tax=Salinadaptatus halalkaliphilus TaxID=2419781 RepID=A0A4S3TKH0_9EURY|nr:hypothetical protein [Salinadaptatus halalkaliphilus]THE64591.1 hypothetical protein D8Y22_12245 [Salinadaptatus halalkaliphilus]
MYPLLADGIRNSIQGAVVDFVDFLPVLFGAAVIVLCGVAIGNKLQPIVTSVSRRIEFDEKVHQTPFAALFSDEPNAVSRAFALLVKYYVVLIAFVVAVEWTVSRHIGTSTWFLRDWAREFLGDIQPIVLGVIVLFLGFYLASYAADQVRASDVAQGSSFSPQFAGGTKALLYFVVLVIGLDTMGINVAILHTFAQAFAYGIGLAAALAIGIAFGWGGKDYVADNLEGWLENSKAVADDAKAAPSDD